MSLAELKSNETWQGVRWGWATRPQALTNDILVCLCLVVRLLHHCRSVSAHFLSGCSVFENCKRCNNGTWGPRDDFFVRGSYCAECRPGWSGGDCMSKPLHRESSKAFPPNDFLLQHALFSSVGPLFMPTVPPPYSCGELILACAWSHKSLACVWKCLAEGLNVIDVCLYVARSRFR